MVIKDKWNDNNDKKGKKESKTKKKKKKVSEKRNQKGRTATGKNAKSLGETQVLTQKY